MRVRNTNEILVPGTGNPPAYFMFHLKGIQTKGLVDGMGLKPDMIVIAAGTYRYTAVSGAVLTVPSYMVPVPLTKQEFADALAKGIKLPK